jgi:phage/plasmid-associated DNA primase
MDKHLEQKLMEEGPGILNWLLERARRWYGEGLQTPNIIASATDEYRAEMDVIGNFIREQCVKGEGCSISNLTFSGSFCRKKRRARDWRGAKRSLRSAQRMERQWNPEKPGFRRKAPEMRPIYREKSL